MSKRLKVILISLTTLFILYLISVDINYNRVKKGKNPLLPYRTINVSNFEVDYGSKDFVPIKYNDYKIYKIFGYNLVKCEKCTKEVYIMPLGIGNYPNETLDCGLEDNSYNESLFFKEGKLETINTIKITSDPSDEDLDEFNATTGCLATFSSNSEKKYTLNKSCNLSLMSDEDIVNLYGVERDDLDLSKKEMIKLYKKNNPEMKCRNIN